jgi:type IV secretion system protein VirB10
VNLRVKQEAPEAPKTPVVENVRWEPEKKRWFDNDRFKVNLLLDKARQPQTEADIVKRSTDDAGFKLRQFEIEQEFLLKVEEIKLRTKDQLEAEALAYTAAQAPLDIKVEARKQQNAAPGGVLAETRERTAGVAIPLPPGQAPAEDLNRQDRKAAFLRDGVAAGEYLPHMKKPPLSPYEIKAGTYIPAALITGINSDLPGNIVAQVTENVYDTADGQYALIPQGARLVGMYDSQVTFGQNRALVVWTRLIFPDGASVNLERMQGVDIAGYAGFKDRVDNHYLRIYGNALLLSLVGAGYDLLNKPGDQEKNNATQSVAANVGQKLADVSSESIKNNLNTQPTIMIRPGYKFKVMVMKDMVLEDLTSP